MMRNDVNEVSWKKHRTRLQALLAHRSSHQAQNSRIKLHHEAITCETLLSLVISMM
jgi:hypothetical protein